MTQNGHLHALGVKMSQAYPSLSSSKLTTHYAPRVLLLSPVLMNGAEVYASIMLLLLLVPVSTSALSRCSSLLTMRLADHCQLNGWVMGEMILLA
jgi:hypothetical protein